MVGLTISSYIIRRVLKDLIQTVIIQHGEVQRGVAEFLGICRCTPHQATGMPPAELPHKRKMRARLETEGFEPIGEDTVAGLQRLWKLVREYQEKAKTHSDASRRKKPTSSPLAIFSECACPSRCHRDIRG